MQNEKHGKKEKKKPTEKALGMIELVSRKNDPSGSYTGKPLDKDEMPVQDADDL